DIESNTMDALSVRVVTVVAKLLSHVQHDQKKAANAGRHPDDVDAGIERLLQQIPRSSAKVRHQHYSYLKANTGFALAARAATVPTVTQAMQSAMAPLPMKTSGVRSMRYAKLDSQLCMAKYATGHA